LRGAFFLDRLLRPFVFNHQYHKISVVLMTKIIQIWDFTIGTKNLQRYLCHVFKKIITIILIYAILLQGGTKVGIFAFYKLNQDYISKVFCENRNNPVVHCNGKCYLSKQLKTQEEKDKKAPVDVKGRSILLFCPTNSISIVKSVVINNAEGNKEYFIVNYVVDRPAIFHPPLC
jgi:hypothetical protein